VRHIQRNDGYCLVLGAPRRFGAAQSSRLSPDEILAGYRTTGPDFVNQLAGGFGIVVHDAVSQRTLLAIDRFGIYPIAYRLLDNAVVFGRFADEVAKLLPDGERLSSQALFDYLFFHVIPGDATVFEGIRRLEAAHLAEFANGQWMVRRYWTPDYSPTTRSEAALTEEFRDLMRSSVGNEVDPNTTGCYLSGGTDSSSVAGWLGRVTGQPPRCFSIGFEAEGYDEMSYARIAAKAYGADHTEYYVTPADIVRGVPLLAEHYDQPFGNSSALPALYCARRAHERGIAVMLAGDGGDEIFGGNTRYAKQKVFEVYFSVPSALRSAFIEPLFSRSPVGRLPVARKVASYIAQARQGLPDRLQSYNLLRRLGPESMLTPRFLDGIDQDAPDIAARRVYEQCRDSEVVNRLLAFDLKYTLADADLPKVVHTCEMGGCEVRFPLLADELVEFANHLPASLKVKGFRLRHFFKEASRGFLPDEIIGKSKHGFGLPFGTWVVRDSTLNRFARDSLANLVDRGMIQGSFLDEIMGPRLAEHAGFYGEAVWILMVLEQWLRVHAPGHRV
jgi:asparagine synthase (glutamine-hydrolysing)